MGMKRKMWSYFLVSQRSFSAQPRADGDEAALAVLVLSDVLCFSAQPRADGDEAPH